MTIWYTSDIHGWHTMILKYQPHRLTVFGDMDSMNSGLIDNINKYVSRNDELYILGDFIWKPSMYGKFRQRLKVRHIHIIAGNHDSPSLRQHVTSYHEILYKKFGDQKIHMCHYPLYSWRAKEHGSIHLYGHCHGSIEDKLDSLSPNRKSMDVGMDNAYRLFKEFRPFSLEEILERFRNCDSPTNHTI
jgi:calcineurin-like phosphoesterase family protein